MLYRFGWVYGITKCFGGITSIFAQNYHKGIFEIGLGIIVGTGCATVGFNLTKYRSRVMYYVKRAFFAMNAAIQSKNANHRCVGRINQISTTTRRYTPVTQLLVNPITENREYGHSDITTGLLNQDIESRRRSQ